jgi:hypothetical protein
MMTKMNLLIQIPPQLEEPLRQQASVTGQNVESFVVQAVESTLASLSPMPTPQRPPRDRWFAELKAWAESHPRVEHFVDDSRESIYPDRD